MISVKRGVGVAVAVYVAMVAVATVGFAMWRGYLLTGQASRYAFMLLGSAVSLHTHSGLSLFLLQSVFLIAIISGAVLSPKMRVPAIVVALVIWGYVGWTMADGFIE
jgi:hypothetical protein